MKHKILSIVLKSASGIEARHCVINLKEGIATLVPQSEDAMCMINAVTVNQPIRLYQGCVIVLGKTNMFRYLFFHYILFFFLSFKLYEHTMYTTEQSFAKVLKWRRCHWFFHPVHQNFSKIIKSQINYIFRIVKIWHKSIFQ